MKVEVIQDAPVLMPNKDHQNFTTTEEVIKAGVILEGEEKRIAGLRRGQPFTYRLFLTNDKQFIYINKTKPMTTTEVTLGADAKVSPTIVDIPATKKAITPTILIAVATGLAAGYGWSKHKSLDKKKTILFTLGAGVVGYFAGKYIEKRKGIVIKPSK